MAGDDASCSVHDSMVSSSSSSSSVVDAAVCCAQQARQSVSSSYIQLVGPRLLQSTSAIDLDSWRDRRHSNETRTCLSGSFISISLVFKWSTSNAASVDLQQVPAVSHNFFGVDRSTPTSALAAAMAARYAVPAAAVFGAADSGSSATDGGSAGVRFRRAVYRVLIALSFKSFRRRNETKRRRERSDCSEARFLPAAPTPVEDDTLAPEDDIQYVTAVRHRTLLFTCRPAYKARPVFYSLMQYGIYTLGHKRCHLSFWLYLRCFFVNFSYTFLHQLKENRILYNLYT